MIDAILKLLGPGFVMGMAVGAYALFWWDHRPPDTPSVHWRGPGLLSFAQFSWTAPDSLAAVRDRALADDGAWADDFATLKNAFSEENAAVVSLQTNSQRWRAASRAAGLQAAAANRWRLTLASRIAAAPSPTDASELGLCRAADAILLRGAQ